MTSRSSSEQQQQQQQPSTVAAIGPLLRELVQQHVPPSRFQSALAVATRLLDSALTTAPSMQSADTLTRTMTFRLKRDGRDEHASQLSTLMTSLKFDRAFAPHALWPVLYILNDLRGTSATAPSLPPLSNYNALPSPSTRAVGSIPTSASTGSIIASRSAAKVPTAATATPVPRSNTTPNANNNDNPDGVLNSSSKANVNPNPVPAVDFFEPSPTVQTPNQIASQAATATHDSRRSSSPNPSHSAKAHSSSTSSPSSVRPSRSSRHTKPKTPRQNQTQTNDAISAGANQEIVGLTGLNRSLERLLVQDLLLIVQGEQGAHLSFGDAGHRRDDEMIKINFPHGTHLPLPVIDMVHYISELGFLFRVVRTHISEATASSTISALSAQTVSEYGLVAQNLYTAIDRELDNYYRSLSNLREPAQPDDASNGQTKVGLTLRELFVWAEREKLRLRWLARLCEETRSLNGGGQIIAHLRARRGAYVSLEIRDMMSRILRAACAPLNRMLIRWLSDGTLSDTHGEFFIMEDPKVAANVAANPFSAESVDDAGLAGGPNTASAASHRIWWGLFKTRREMMPGGCIDRNTAQKALITGKSVAFMRRCCSDSEWVDSVHAPLIEALTPPHKDLFEADPREEHERANAVQQVVIKACESASKRLKELFFERFDLNHHFGAIKNYLLLSQGDFAQALMDGLASLLDGGGEILQHNLTGFVDAALQSCSSFNESTDWDILERLDVQIDVYDSTSNVGWDVFSLTYRVEDAPLNTVFSPKVMDAYLLVFRLLWRLKRMDHLMSAVYMSLRETEKRRRRRQQLGDAYDGSEDDTDDEQARRRRLSRAKAKRRSKGWSLLGGGNDEDGRRASKMWKTSRKSRAISCVMKRVHLLRIKIIHLVHNMQQYCKVEVLEGCWAELERDMKEAADLDGMIVAHALYLTKIKDMTLQSDRSQYVATELNAVLDTVPRFSKMQKEICAWALTADDVDEFAGGGDGDEDCDDGGINESTALDPSEKSETEQQAEKMLSKLNEIEQDFDIGFAKLITVLSKHCQMVDACEFLLFRLDYNEYYARSELEATTNATASEV